ncbi:MAG: adenosylcobinamide-GDP ribazoletransferase [Pseudomonadota bacterium]
MRRPSASSPLWHPLLAGLLLTRLPLPHVPEAVFSQSKQAVWAYPLVGLVLGGIAVTVGFAAPTPAIGAGLALAALAISTGALHEDGLADTADGLWGGHTRDRRLEIMKDSRIGAYGVLALIMVTGLRWAALMAAGLPALIASAALSRSMMPAVMAALPHARDQGLSHSVGRPSALLAGLSVAVGLGIAWGATGAPAMFAALAAIAASTAIAFIAKHKIGGQTGDICGATQQMSEVAILIALAYAAPTA